MSVWRARLLQRNKLQLFRPPMTRRSKPRVSSIIDHLCIGWNYVSRYEEYNQIKSLISCDIFHTTIRLKTRWAITMISKSLETTCRQPSFGPKLWNHQQWNHQLWNQQQWNMVKPTAVKLAAVKHGETISCETHGGSFCHEEDLSRLRHLSCHQPSGHTLICV